MKTNLIAVIALITGFILPANVVSQERIRIESNGHTVNILDFARAYLASHHDDDFCRAAARKLSKGSHSNGNEATTVDSRNGFFAYEQTDKRDKTATRIEICYWNCDNKREKLVAVNRLFTSGSMTESDLTFYRYSTRSGVMTLMRAPFDRVPQPGDMLNRARADEKTKRRVTTARNEDANAFQPSYSLPRTGKDITFRFADPDAVPRSAQRQGIMRWNGNGFNISF